MTDGFDFFVFAGQSARDEFIKGVVEETLEKHGIGRRTEPVCKACGGTMRHVTWDLWQCKSCKTVEAL